MRWLDRPQNVARLYRALWVLGAALLAAELVVHRHAETSLDGWPAFYGVYGFVACVALVVAAKFLRRIVMQPEDYYDR